MTPPEIAESAAEAIRALNHSTRPGVAHAGSGIDVTEVYDLLGELVLMASRLPQLLGQIEATIDTLVDADLVTIVDGPNAGDPVAAAAICGHWLDAAARLAAELAPRIGAAQQTLAWAAATRD